MDLIIKRTASLVQQQYNSTPNPIMQNFNHETEHSFKHLYITSSNLT